MTIAQHLESACRIVQRLEGRVGIQDVIKRVSEEGGIGTSELTGPRGSPRVCSLRHAAMYLMRQAGCSYPEIGRKCGGKDHATAMYGVNRIEDAFAYLNSRNEALQPTLFELGE